MSSARSLLASSASWYEQPCNDMETMQIDTYVLFGLLPSVSGAACPVQ